MYIPKKVSFSLALVMVASTLSLYVPSLHATPYASGVTNDGSGNISYILNESADDVQILLTTGGVTVTNDLGAKAKGLQASFSLSTATNFQIVVKKNSGPGWRTGPGNGGNTTALQISTDTTLSLNTFLPKGMAINENPKSPFFGRIYIANDQSGTTTTHASRATTAGIYVLNADYSDPLGQGNTASTGGLNLTAASDSNPYKIRVGDDDNLYICDWSDATGNLYRTDPNVSSGSGIFALKQISGTATVPVGANNNHGSVASCWVSGTQAASNMFIYTIDEDLQASKTQTNLNQLNSLWSYNVGVNSLPFGSDPTRLWTATPAGGGGDGYAAASQVMDLYRAPDGRFFITDQRSNGGESGLLVRNSTSTTTQFSSHALSTNLAGSTSATDLLANSVSVAVSPDDKWVAVGRSDGKAWIMPLTNGIPDITKRNLLTMFSTSTTRQVAFDAADNLYGVNNGEEAMRVLSPGGNSTAITGNDNTGTNGTFSLSFADPSIFSGPANVTANAGTTATFTVTATGSGVLSYQWRFNGTNVSGATASSYAQANIQAPRLGNYDVIVSNSLNTITSSVATLTIVDTGPIITVQPVPKTNNAGTSVTFTVSSSGTDPRSYQWRYDDFPISGATASSYTRTDVQSTDQANYSVVISNAFSPFTTNSAEAMLTVIDTAPIITTQPASKTNGAGVNLTLSVTTTGTDPRSWQWYSNSVAIAGATASSYIVVNPQIGNTGDAYSVAISNSVAPNVTNSGNATLTITNATPTIIAQPAGVGVNVGDNASFTVGAQGQADLTYQWLSNSVAIADGTAPSGMVVSGSTNATLSLAGVQLADAAFYSVTVTSGAGTFSTNSAAAQLAVIIGSTPGTGTGLRGDYYTSQTQTFSNAPTLTRLDTNVDFVWGTGSPDASISVDHFTTRWTGKVQPLYSQDYTFYTKSDDGSRLWVNGQLIVNKWVSQSVTETPGSPVTLVAGQKYDLVMEYYENTSTAEVHLLWSSTSQLKQAIATPQLYPAALGPQIQPVLSTAFSKSNIVFNWSGSYTLQSAVAAVGPYTNLTTLGVGPSTNTLVSDPERFFRLKAN